MNKTLLFHWGFEGGGSDVFRITENGKDRIVQRYSYMDFDANDDEIWHQGENQFESFEAYWKEATKDKNWFRGHLVFIHNECKPLIRKSIEAIDVVGLTENEQMVIDRWKMML